MRLFSHPPSWGMRAGAYRLRQAERAGVNRGRDALTLTALSPTSTRELERYATWAFVVAQIGIRTVRGAPGRTRTRRRASRRYWNVRSTGSIAAGAARRIVNQPDTRRSGASGQTKTAPDLASHPSAYRPRAY